ncbi:MAG: fatty acid oxidation complex subunit alpha FadB, partial [Pseudomonadales bacterium]|nr:fatty acid oxidation complex subunit alpha FadB [Pseudomonadales bacterium]
MFKGDAISLKSLEGGVVEMNFDLKGESVYKFNSVTVQELGKALDELESVKELKGVLVSSGKPVFIVGADITEFESTFGSD